MSLRLADVKLIPIPPPESAIFYMFCRVVTGESSGTSATDSQATRSAVLTKILGEDRLSDADWNSMITAVESVASKLDRLALEQRSLAARGEANRKRIDEWDQRRKAVLDRGLALLRAHLTPAGRQTLELILNQLKKNISGVRIRVE